MPEAGVNVADLKLEQTQVRLRALPAGCHAVATALHTEICGLDGPAEKSLVQLCLHVWFLKRTRAGLPLAVRTRSREAELPALRPWYCIMSAWA